MMMQKYNNLNNIRKLRVLSLINKDKKRNFKGEILLLRLYGIILNLLELLEIYLKQRSIS
jgi:hypothetical protein